jgi:Cu2+-exporting ATPase
MNNCHEHNSKGSHKNHGSHLDAMSHGSAQEFLRRFWIVTFLLIPLVLSNETVSGILNIEIFDLNKFVQFGVATIIFYFSLVFFKHAWHEIKSRKYGMMTLVSLAVGAGYIFSASSTFIAALNVEFYLEISTLIWVLLFGHYLEARSTASAGNALKEVAKLLPNRAHRLRGDVEIEDVDTAELVEGDIVLVKPGEKIPADGVVIRGSSNVNESLISGESKPVAKETDDDVVAGSISLDGSLTIKLSRVGEDSTVGKIQNLIAQAQKTKPSSQRIADKASAILTLVAGVTALLTILVWSLLLGLPFVAAITLGITVLVIACPHALGLAIPTVTMITTSLAVKNGVFIKNLAKIETIRKVDYVVFDKTGTLTKGEFGVTDVTAFGGANEQEVLSIAGSIDKHSSHIIGKSIVDYAQKQKVEFADIDDFKNIAGHGSRAKIAGKEYFVGNEALMKKMNIPVTARLNLDVTGTNVYVADSENVLGVITLADEIKEESRATVDKLHKLGVKVAMLTGDNEAVAKSVADELGIDKYFAEVLPEEKYKHIKDLQDKGNIVLMVGDGVNDAPALTQADAGVAIGAGTDIAVEAGDVVLIKSNPKDIVKLIILSKKVYRKIIQNLVWAFGYNIVAIPAAAGVFAHPIFFGGFFLRPEIGALVMSLSTVIVVANAMMLKRVNLDV